MNGQHWQPCLCEFDTPEPDSLDLIRRGDRIFEHDSAEIIASGVIPAPRSCCPRCRVTRSWRGYGRHFGIETRQRAKDIKAAEVWGVSDFGVLERELHGPAAPPVSTAGDKAPRPWEQAEKAIARAVDAAADNRPYNVRYAPVGLLWGDPPDELAIVNGDAPTSGIDPLLQLMLVMLLDLYIRRSGFTQQESAAYLMAPYASQVEIGQRLSANQSTVSRWQRSVRKALDVDDARYIARLGRRSAA